MKKDLIAIMRAKGIDTPEKAIEDLIASGVLTGFDMSKYLAVNEFMRLSLGVEKPTRILKDVAHRHSIGHTTLRDLRAR